MSSLNNLDRQQNGTKNITDGYDGFSALAEQLKKFIEGVENSTEILLEGAKAFLSDLNKLPRPLSKIRKSGYTHLIDSFTVEKKDKEIVVGWGKYYGRMVERGTDKMSARPHMYPLWEHNKENYQKLMLTKLGM